MSQNKHPLEYQTLERATHSRPRWKTAVIVASFVMCAIGGALFSTALTTIAWSSQIESSAFQCNDSIGWPVDNYWLDVDAHRAAGDTISPGWTWNELKVAKAAYIAVFYLLWIFGTLVSFRVVLRRIRRLGIRSSREAPVATF